MEYSKNKTSWVMLSKDGGFVSVAKKRDEHLSTNRWEFIAFIGWPVLLVLSSTFSKLAYLYLMDHQMFYNLFMVLLYRIFWGWSLMRVIRGARIAIALWGRVMLGERSILRSALYHVGNITAKCPSRGHISVSCLHSFELSLF